MYLLGNRTGYTAREEKFVFQLSDDSLKLSVDNKTYFEMKELDDLSFSFFADLMPLTFERVN